MAVERHAGDEVSSYESNKDRLVQLQIRKERLDLASRRIGVFFKSFLAVLWIGATAGVLLIAWHASRGREVVIEPADVSASLKGSAIDGESLARLVRAELLQMAGETRDLRETPSNLRVSSRDWQREYPLAIPETGLTLGQIASSFRRLLGQDTRVSGTLIREGEDFILTTRVGESTNVARSPSLRVVAHEAAGQIFERTDPYFYALYLADRGDAEAVATSTRLFHRLAREAPSPADRARAWNGFAQTAMESTGECRRVIPTLLAAAEMDPLQPLIQDTLSNAYYCIGRNQEAADATSRAMRLLMQQIYDIDPRRLPKLFLVTAENEAEYYGDYRRRLWLYRGLETFGQVDRSLERARALADQRDIAASAEVLTRYCNERLFLGAPCEERGRYWEVLSGQAWALEHWADAAEHLEESRNRYGMAPYTRAQLSTQTTPLEAIAHARGGALARARALVRELPADCYLCARARAVVAEAGGDSRLADVWFRRAIALGPRLPSAYAEWGEVMLARNDPLPALELFERAVEFGSNFPDALKGKADTLARLGRTNDAISFYQCALEQAPRWGALNIAFARSLWRAARRDEARERLRAARGMVLNSRDLGLLNRMIAISGA